MEGSLAHGLAAVEMPIARHAVMGDSRAGEMSVFSMLVISCIIYRAASSGVQGRYKEKKRSRNEYERNHHISFKRRYNISAQ